MIPWMDPLTRSIEPSPEAEADPGYPEGAEEEGTGQPDEQGGTALAREEEQAFEPDPVVEVEGEDLETVRTRAADTITRAVRSGQFRRALATATPPNPPPLDPDYLNTPHRPQVYHHMLNFVGRPRQKRALEACQYLHKSPKPKLLNRSIIDPKGHSNHVSADLSGFNMLRVIHHRSQSQ